MAVRFLVRLSAIALVFVASAQAVSAAETRVRARYDLTLAGFNIGTASMQAGIQDQSYDLNVSARMTGLARFLTGGRGAATARGAVRDATVAPAAYAINTRSGEKGQVIRFALAAGAIRSMLVEPPARTEGIVPVSDSDKRGVLDPVSALMMPVAGAGDPLASSSCNRTLPVFDGRQRFDVTLRYDRTETVKGASSAPGQYEGQAIVCKASYKAISGHRPGRKQVAFMESNKDMEVWLAPVAGTRALLPWKISVRTEVGVAVIAASSFVVVRPGDKDKKVGADL
ncbi:DUF3108 domain-containing protein [Methylopila turkensis]|uniref:DUF3108 domain-containing protein n=1 Tax=Methylopila turkensis TaxID=1437816 RepID=UPI0022F2AE35|nr:DUF3108 domain-containing protein [Methylopila turkensis]